MHLVAWLRGELNAQAAARMAAAHGLRLLPIVRTSQRSLPREGLLFGFARATPTQLRAGVHTLGRALRTE